MRPTMRDSVAEAIHPPLWNRTFDDRVHLLTECVHHSKEFAHLNRILEPYGGDRSRSPTQVNPSAFALAAHAKQKAKMRKTEDTGTLIDPSSPGFRWPSQQSARRNSIDDVYRAIDRKLCPSLQSRMAGKACAAPINAPRSYPLKAAMKFQLATPRGRSHSVPGSRRFGALPPLVSQYQPPSVSSVSNGFEKRFSITTAVWPQSRAPVADFVIEVTPRQHRSASVPTTPHNIHKTDHSRMYPSSVHAAGDQPLAVYVDGRSLYCPHCHSWSRATTCASCSAPLS